MKFRVAFLILMAGASLAFAGEGDIVMEGKYHWAREGEVPSDIKAVFTPTGTDEYNVSFYFKFRNEDHTYTGTATGNLDNGELSGKVKNDNKTRNFTFKGTTTDGAFDGTHMEIGGRYGTRDTGTMTLKKSVKSLR